MTHLLIGFYILGSIFFYSTAEAKRAGMSVRLILTIFWPVFILGDLVIAFFREINKH